MATQRLGTINSGVDPLEGFEKLLQTTVLFALNAEAKVSNLITNIPLPMGYKSISIPIVNSVDDEATLFTPGDTLSSDDYKNARIEIDIDGAYHAPLEVYKQDLYMDGLNLTEAYLVKAKEKLINTKERIAIREICNSARTTTAVVEGDFVGGKVTLALAYNTDTVDNKAKALIQGIFESKKEMTKKNVTEEMFCIVNPDEYAILTSNLLVIQAAVGETMFVDGKIAKIGGITILETNHFQKTDQSAKPHGLDMTNTVALVFTKSAVAMAQLQGIEVEEMDYDSKKQSYFTTASFMPGCKPMRSSHAIEIDVATV